MAATAVVLSGIDGSVSIAASAVANITAWAAEVTHDLSGYITSSTSTWEEQTSGGNRWSGSADFLCDGEEPENFPFASMVAGTEVAMILTGSTGQGWSGDAKIETINFNSPVSADQISGSFTFKGCGALANIA